MRTHNSYSNRPISNVTIVISILVKNTVVQAYIRSIQISPQKLHRKNGEEQAKSQLNFTNIFQNCIVMYPGKI